MDASGQIQLTTDLDDAPIIAYQVSVVVTSRGSFYLRQLSKCHQMRYLHRR
jgi:hypothetical protein